MNAPCKLLVALCVMVAIYAGCLHAWWIMDSWIVSALCALGWGSDKELVKNGNFNEKSDNIGGAQPLQ